MKALFTILTLPLVLAGCGSDEWKRTDNVKIINELNSPDGKHVATVFFCSGGGAAGYTYYNVSLRKTGDDLNQRDFLLGKYNWHSFKDINITWIDSANLQVSYQWNGTNPEHRSKNNDRVASKDGVNIQYILNDVE